MHLDFALALASRPLARLARTALVCDALPEGGAHPLDVELADLREALDEELVVLAQLVHVQRVDVALLADLRLVRVLLEVLSHGLRHPLFVHGNDAIAQVKCLVEAQESA